MPIDLTAARAAHDAVGAALDQLAAAAQAVDSAETQVATRQQALDAAIAARDEAGIALEARDGDAELALRSLVDALQAINVDLPPPAPAEQTDGEEP